MPGLAAHPHLRSLILRKLPPIQGQLSEYLGVAFCRQKEMSISAAHLTTREDSLARNTY